MFFQFTQNEVECESVFLIEMTGSNGFIISLQREASPHEIFKTIRWKGVSGDAQNTVPLKWARQISRNI